jgi:hypothetical protein
MPQMVNTTTTSCRCRESCFASITTLDHIAEFIVALILCTVFTQVVHVRNVVRQFAAILAERARIARDIHDTLAQQGIWRGIADYAKALDQAAVVDSTLKPKASRLQVLAEEMRAKIERSLVRTMSQRNDAMKRADISPFTPEDTRRDPKMLSSYGNHRFMQNWFLADWGDPDLDAGHLRHRTLSGMQWVGLHMDGTEPRTSNFMEHGTFSVKIREDDHRSFLLCGLVCFAADSGNRYSPEDALLPGGAAGEGQKYSWSATVNSVLQPTLGLRWLLCYEESDKPARSPAEGSPQQLVCSRQGDRSGALSNPLRPHHVEDGSEGRRALDRPPPTSASLQC